MQSQLQSGQVNVKAEELNSMWLGQIDTFKPSSAFGYDFRAIPSIEPGSILWILWTWR